MEVNRLREIEAETLANFKKHRPSEYFSHLDGEAPFEDLKKTVESVYRYGLCFPPEFFKLAVMFISADLLKLSTQRDIPF